MPETCLVTGAAGFIGSHLCEGLLNDGWTVRGVDCLTDFTPIADKRRRLAVLAGHGPRFSFVARDLSRGRIDPELAGADVVFHLAGQAGVRDSFGPGLVSHIDRNIRATQRLAEAIRRRGGGRLVLASSSSVYGEATGRGPVAERAPTRPSSPYGMTKLVAEGVARSICPETVVVRYFTVFGPGQRPDMAFHRFIAAALDGPPAPLFGDGTQIRDFTFAGDAVSATIAAATRGDGVYNVGGGSPASLNDALRHIGELTGRPVPLLPGLPGPGHVHRTWADTRRARRDLGWAPAVGLRDGLALQLADMRAALAARGAA